MRKFLLAGTGILVLAIFFLNTYLTNHVYPNTFFDSKNVSGYSKDTLLKYLAQQGQLPITIHVKYRVYTYTLSQLGIIFDLNKTTDRLLTSTQLSFPKNVLAYIDALHSQRMVQPQLVFTQKFYEQFANDIYDFSTKSDEISVDQTDQQLVFTSYEDKYQIDPKSLMQVITAEFGKNKPILAQLTKITPEGNPVTISTYNKNLIKIAATPVVVSLPTVDTPITLAPEDLKKLLIISYDNSTQQLGIDVDANLLQKLAQNQATQLLGRTDMAIDSVALKKSLVSLATSRFNNIDTSFIQGTLVQIPQSHGEIAQKYIEIDIRQQMMYLWEGGNTIATHRVSTGLYYPTPPGTYHILNKALNAYSDIYHVWMPYWMAFYLDPKVNAYLGIHELPYWVTGNGQEIRRPRDFIGSPHTGGCVSLDLGEAQLVYNWAEVGTTVVVYE